MNSKTTRSANRNTPLFLIVAGLLLIVGIFLFQTLSNTTELTAGIPSANPTIDPISGVKRVNLTDAKKAFDGKTAIFVDVRDPDSYSTGHIPGAINIPMSDIETRYRELKSNQWIITYCT